MANALDAYIPEIWAQESLMWLRKNLVLASLVHRDFENEVAARGDTVNTRKPKSFTAQAFTGTVTIQDAQADNVPVVLDQHIHVAFEISDKDRSLAIKDLVEEYLGPAGYAVADKIDQDIWALYKDVPYNFGTAGTTPSAVSDITGIRKVQNDRLVPLPQRRLVLDSAAEEKFLQLSTFHEANKVGDEGTALREASLGRKFGMDFFMDQNAPQQTAGVPGGTPLVNGAHLAGDATIVIDGGGASGTYKKGDIVTFAGDTAPYAVVSDLTLDGTGNGTLTITPALRVNIADNAAITLKATHRVNLAFHRNAFALVSRPLDTPPVGDVRTAIAQSDGIGVRVTIGYDIRKLSVVGVLDLLYGVKTLDLELAARLLG
ncbi:MAG: P22 phage major capsid protein family protein [Anaerolineales bacterium]